MTKLICVEKWMKRIALSTLSLALLGAAGAAHAQSSVTLYGLIDESIQYVSPVWSGFQVEGVYALGGVAGATGAGQSWGGAATWSGGPFSAAAGYFRMENGNTLASRGITPATPAGPGTWSAGATSGAT